MNAHARNRTPIRQAMLLLAAWAMVLTPAFDALQAQQQQRTQVKPGWNMFSVQDDVEIGRSVAADAEKKLNMLNDSRVDNYLNRLGRQLASKANGPDFPYQFKAVNDRSINAFALPGGFIYVHRGIIEAAENEAQLAGVMGHEIAHSALRHGTNQASKAQAWGGVLGIFGGLVGSNSVAAIAAQLGAGFAVNSVILKYSRDAERQADIMGTHILYDNNMDPRAMAQFFEKIHAQGGSRAPEFFSSHPRPDNRMERVMEEIQRMGGSPPNYRTDSAEFREIKRYVASLPAPGKTGTGATGSGASGTSGATGRPDLPADRYQGFSNDLVVMDHPVNWRAYGQASAVTFAPERGILESRGSSALAYGMIVAPYQPQPDRRGQISLESATDQLVADMARSNPGMRLARQAQRVRLNTGDRALSIVYQNDSALGGKETLWLVTVLRSDGLMIYFVGVAPESEFRTYERPFQRMISSVRFR